MIEFTVFIPVYNGEDVLERLSNNLKSIGWFGRPDIEIFIVNDGSTDKSFDLIQELFDFDNVFIRHHRRNRHKMTVFMETVKISRGRRFLTLDCDDEIVYNSLAEMLDYERLNNLSEDNCSGIIGNVVDQYGQLVGSKFAINGLRASTFECYYIHGIKGEKWGFTYTSLLQETINTEVNISEGKHTPESVVWMGVSKNKRYFYVNNTWRIYYVDERANSITVKAKETRNYYGIMMENGAILKYNFRALLCVPKLLFRVLFMYLLSTFFIWIRRK